MTDLMQPVDLVANAPIKVRVRSARARQLYSYFQEFCIDYAAAPSTTIYNPPAPTMASYIGLVSDIFSHAFTTDSFASGVSRCFVSVGLAPISEANYDFTKYVSHDDASKRVKNFRGKVHDHDISALELLADFQLIADADDEADEEFGSGDIGSESDADAYESGADNTES